jgi:hypothetical protein
MEANDEADERPQEIETVEQEADEPGEDDEDRLSRRDDPEPDGDLADRGSIRDLNLGAAKRVSSFAKAYGTDRDYSNRQQDRN